MFFLHENSLPNVFFQGLKIGKVPDAFCKFIGKFRNVFLLDGAGGCSECNFFAGKGAVLKIRGELQIELFCFTGRNADKVIFKSGNKSPLPYGNRVTL